MRWKIDLYLLPLLTWVYALQYLDKVSYGQSANFGALVDLELETKTATGGSDLSRFRIGSMIFWCGCQSFLSILHWMATKSSISDLLNVPSIVIAGVYPVSLTVYQRRCATLTEVFCLAHLHRSESPSKQDVLGLHHNLGHSFHPRICLQQLARHLRSTIHARVF